MRAELDGGALARHQLRLAGEVADELELASPDAQPLVRLLEGDLVRFAARELPARIIRGRPGRLLTRAAITALLSLAVLQLIPGTAAAPADITALITWFVLTGRRDLAPPPER